MRKLVRRAAMTTAALAIAGTALAATSAPANAMQPQWYPCWVSGYGWMHCMDV
ncbi:hypothetical protein [Sphaerisporangium album]|uniref:hypothetical protein n=1 Tax=Sphaerisporangium album TaxID=509200 RepID=UPI0015F04F0E|nr:hypothetical protein [Sphaerisporangium album]